MKKITMKEFEVIIIGGSYAGLSAAMTLGRSLRDTLVIDSGKPCNRQTPHSHNFLTQDGKTPREIGVLAKTQVKQYKTVSFLNDTVIFGERSNDLFELKTKSGKALLAKKLIFATGIKDITPSIKGFSECWGITVIHCPYCHGFEFRNKKTAIMANGDRAFHLIPLVKNLTEEVTVLTSGPAEFSETQVDKLNQEGVKIEESDISEIIHDNGQIRKVVFRNGKALELDAMYAAIPFEQHSNVPKEMGCKINDMGFIEVDSFQKTSQTGVFACGDNSTYFRSVANAVSNGNIAGASINKELSDEKFEIEKTAHNNG